MRYDTDAEDFVTAILRAISNRNPGMDLLEVEIGMCRQWGGKRCYIAKTSAAVRAQRREARVDAPR